MYKFLPVTACLPTTLPSFQVVCLLQAGQPASQTFWLFPFAEAQPAMYVRRQHCLQISKALEGLLLPKAFFSVSCLSKSLPHSGLGLLLPGQFSPCLPVWPVTVTGLPNHAWGRLSLSSGGEGHGKTSLPSPLYFVFALHWHPPLYLLLCAFSGITPTWTWCGETVVFGGEEGGRLPHLFTFWHGMA